MGDETAGGWKSDLVKLAWSNKELILSKLVALKDWVFGPKASDGSRVLIIGSGGVGKSSTARFFAGESPVALVQPYEESLAIESFALEDDSTVELVVPPGQEHRRDTTWGAIEKTIATGGYHGIISVGAFGFHSLGDISYTKHRLFTGDREEFLARYLADRRQDELAIIRRLTPFVVSNRSRLWMLSLVTKQDLWWNERDAVRGYYADGEYGQLLSGISGNLSQHHFRHELAGVSLVIGNFVTGRGEVLAQTVAGYEQKTQIESQQRLYETLAALKDWEEQ